MTRTLLHIDLLGRLYVVAGWLAMLASLALACLALGAFGIAIEGGPDVAIGLAAAIFFALAALSALWGGVLVVVGWAVSQRQAWARPAALILAVINVFMIPFGTALAAYACWVLLQEESKRAFEP